MRAYLIWGLLHIIAWLPLPLLHGIGYIAGNLLSVLPSRLRATSTRNIGQCLPELSGTQQCQPDRNGNGHHRDRPPVAATGQSGTASDPLG